MIKCLRCNKEFKFNYLLIRHNNRKFPCKRVEEKEAQRSAKMRKEAHRCAQINIYDSTLKSDKTSGEKKQCEFCNKLIIQRDIPRHKRNSCLKIPEKLKKKLIDKYNKDKRVKNKQIVIHNNNNNNNSSNTTNNNTINNNLVNSTINNYTTNNKININLNAFGKENISSIKEENILEILNKAYAGFPLILKQLHFNIEENRNIYQPNLNKPFIKYYNGKRWESDKFDSISQMIFNNVSRTLEDWFEEYQTKLHEKKQELINKFINDCNDGREDKKFIEELKMFFMDYSNEIKENIINKIKKTNFM